MKRLAFLSLLTFATLGAATPVSAQTYTCRCDGYCGNGARGANPGTVVKGVRHADLSRYYGLEGPGKSRRTGWACAANAPIQPMRPARPIRPLKPTVQPNLGATPSALAARGKSFYLRASDQPLYLHAHGGTRPGAQETLHPCPKGNNHPNCQWILERSPTTRGAYYLRSTGGPLYLHAHGGTQGGANLTLHACPKGNDHPNCQWIFEKSATRRGAWYLRSKGGALFAHSHGGSNSGARQTLHPCPKGNDHGNCQWRIEPNP